MIYYKKILKWAGLLFVFVLMVLVLKKFNPYETRIFPACPFFTITGLKCPGCGSQRAIHFLLNGDLFHAAKENFLLVFSIPYIALAFYYDLKRDKTEGEIKWRKRMYGLKAIIILLGVIVLFWILRNIFLF
jgi:hypothetical protein